MYMKKAQAAMEFLMTYGWAILVVLIAIGALVYFVKPQQILGQNCILSPGLNCKSYKADTAGITLLIENPGAKDLTVTGVNFTNHAACALSATQSLTSGSSATFTIPCTGGLSSGSQFRDDVRVIYDETDGLTGLVNAGTVFLRVS